MPSSEYLEVIIKGLVDNVDAVRVDRTVDDMGVLLSVTVDPLDMGKIIGRSGATAKAIRIIAGAMAYKNREKVSVRIIEPTH